MSKQYPEDLAGNADLLEFWRGSQGKNIESYYIYDLFTTKTRSFGSFSGFVNKVYMQPTKDYYPIRVYELVISRGDDLFYAYFQTPSVQFPYYEKIMDRALESFVISY